MQDEQMARITTISPEICQWSQHCGIGPWRDSTHSWETVHCIGSSDAARTNLVCDHGTETDGYGNPRESCICCPAVEQIADSGVDEADAKRPEAHLRFLDTTVAASEEDDDSVCGDSGEVSKDATDEG